ncbi:MAG: hypothetical protein ACLP2Y_10760, partial [Limisphaerales bacterium]
PLVQVDRRQKFRLCLRFSTHDSLTYPLRRHSNFLRVFQQTANCFSHGEGGFGFDTHNLSEKLSLTHTAVAP